MERLRDRTDELELIISGLTIFALFSIPGWLFDKIADIYTHLSTSLAIAGILGTTLLAGTSYGLAACFVVHLMARAYWVGLIGLRTVFPGGINWSKTPGLGPLSRQYYRDTLPDLDTVIQNTDRVASSLFAVISMLTLSVLWFGTILIVILVMSGVVGARLGNGTGTATSCTARVINDNNSAWISSTGATTGTALTTVNMGSLSSPGWTDTVQYECNVPGVNGSYRGGVLWVEMGY